MFADITSTIATKWCHFVGPTGHDDAIVNGILARRAAIKP